MTKTILILMALLFATAAQAQTATFKLAWQTPEAPAVASANQYTLKIDADTPIAVTPVCTAQGTGSACLLPLPTTGRTYLLTVFNGFGQASATLSGVPPVAPMLSVIVTISIP